MRRVSSIFIGGVLALCAAACATPAQSVPVDQDPLPPVEARTGVDKALATTGDVITYEIVIEHEAGITVAVPDPGDAIAGFRIVDLGVDAPLERKGRVTERRWYELRADLVGSYVLPPVRLRYSLPPGRAPAPGEEPAPAGDAAAGEDASDTSDAAAAPPSDGSQFLETSEIFVEVQSVLPTDGSAEDIRDIKPLEEMPHPFPWPWAAGGAAAALLAVVALWLILRARGGAPALPPPPAHEVAFAALNALRATDFDDPEAVRLYYFALSEIIRTYVEGRFQLNATDLTTEEILPRLPEITELATSSRDSLTAFLQQTDRIKFAGVTPSPTDIGDTYEAALTFVETTIPAPAAPAATAEQGA